MGPTLPTTHPSFLVLSLVCGTTVFVSGAARNFRPNLYGSYNLYSNWQEGWVPTESDTALIAGPHSNVESDSWVNSIQTLDIGSPSAISNNVSLRISTNAQITASVGIFINNNASFTVNGSTIYGPITVQPYGRLITQSWGTWYVYNNFQTIRVNERASSNIGEFSKIQKFINRGDSVFSGVRLYIDTLQNYQSNIAGYLSWILFDTATPSFVNFNSEGGSIDFLSSTSAMNYTMFSLTEVGSFNSSFNFASGSVSLVTGSTLDLDYSNVSLINSAINNVNSTYYLLGSNLVSNGGSFYLSNSKIVGFSGSKLTFTNTDLQITNSNVSLVQSKLSNNNNLVVNQVNLTLDNSSIQMPGFTLTTNSGSNIGVFGASVINGSLNTANTISFRVSSPTSYSHLNITQLATLSGSIDIDVQPNVYNGAIPLISFGQTPAISSSLRVNIRSSNSTDFNTALQTCASYMFTANQLLVNFTNCAPSSTTTSSATTTTSTGPITITTTTTSCGCPTTSGSSISGSGSTSSSPCTTTTTGPSTHLVYNLIILNKRSLTTVFIFYNTQEWDLIGGSISLPAPFNLDLSRLVNNPPTPAGVSHPLSTAPETNPTSDSQLLKFVQIPNSNMST
ncbi:putative transmembrane protein [Heterostelium album PN500]|uniref:Putative transmembrane protein n=1 Tax=Heterostelium pallidum (strain ATCC 26659 / Pp 5 / PN500) TaxID=670386 RepID=D3BQI3_HETP5|nr:putative transmembrane protein [Heterostelium album PN500]EFA76403.1 putative transmembrane protein [Heterostelium album PN500]|eukprot:XP_020428535.1 putative transmembrane protein [Heterostelium album PN500]